MNAVVFGNGESRKNIDPSLLKSSNTLIGCNAIHRDAIMDHLVCCDRRMVEEAVSSPNTKYTLIYVREDWFKYYRKIQKDKRTHLVPSLPYTGEEKKDQPSHWGSGGYAVLLAASLGYKNISLVGFDLYPMNNKVNNLYKGTQNYSKPDTQAVDYNYWVYQISKVFKHFPETTFTVVNESKWQLPPMWKRPNVDFISLDNFKVDL